MRLKPPLIIHFFFILILGRISECLPRIEEGELTSNSPHLAFSHQQENKTRTILTTPTNECFYRSRGDCPPSEENNRCKKVAEKAVVCCDVNNTLLLEGFSNTSVGSRDIIYLHVINATLSGLDSTLLIRFRWLSSLAITDGSIKRVTEQFKKFSPIVCLNMSNNGIESIDKRALYNLRQMHKLDISHNNLIDLPNFHQDSNITLDISGNNKTSCQSLMGAKNSSAYLDFENMNHTFCSISKSFQWFNSTELLPLKQVDEFFNVNVQAKKNCWPNCTCEYYRTDYVNGVLPTIAFKVDCSGKQLTEMPEVLPRNTIVLNISNNNISVLKMDNECFGNIRELYADNNRIESILSLEGTKFLDNFVALSLRNNTLKSLPTYMLSHILDRNQNTKVVNFGENYLTCDCNTAKNLRVSLLTKQKSIPDYDQIYCEDTHLKVIQLDPSLICHDNQQSWTDYIYYIITIEVTLFVCLVLKVSYDYWVFKTAGYLPWPANKMPKLPCDWLCE